VVRSNGVALVSVTKFCERPASRDERAETTDRGLSALRSDTDVTADGELTRLVLDDF